jgi:crotonobetainyl-CoA:carnitine CoA-transferase CaiB-like acyl-CoA transferase
VSDRATIEPELAAAFRTRTAATWLAVLDAAGVPCEVSVDSNDGETALYDADNQRLGLITEYRHPRLGRTRQYGTLIDFSDTPTGPYGPPPLLGEHTRAVLARLGYGGEEIDDLVARGIVAETPDDYPFEA